MWQPAAGPSASEALAALAIVNQRLVELSKEVVYLNAVVWEMHKKIEGHK